MKAKEYALEYHEIIGKPLSIFYQNVPENENGVTNDIDALYIVCRKMILETSSIMKQRRCQSNDALLGVLR